MTSKLILRVCGEAGQRLQLQTPHPRSSLFAFVIGGTKQQMHTEGQLEHTGAEKNSK